MFKISNKKYKMSFQFSSLKIQSKYSSNIWSFKNFEKINAISDTCLNTVKKISYAAYNDADIINVTNTVNVLNELASIETDVTEEAWTKTQQRKMYEKEADANTG